MSTSPETPVAQLVLDQPGRARVFEQFGIDYCCGGRIPLAEACAALGLAVGDVLAALADAPQPSSSDPELTTMRTDALCTYIVDNHHAYLREELPSLHALVTKVATVHGGRHPELVELAAAYGKVATALANHIVEEESVVFPACIDVEHKGGDERRETFAHLVDEMERDHETVGEGLARIREIARDFAPPADACTSYRAMLGRLAALETDTHRHVHAENNVLFPRAFAA